MCVKMRISSGNIQRAVALFLALIVSIGFARNATAAPPTPALMAGFPMVAGPVVMVMWSPVPGAVKYNVYLNEQPIGKGVATPPFQFPTPEQPGEYRVEVTAVGADGSESGKSRAGRISIVKLLAPKDLNSLAGEKTIAIRWANQPGAVITDIYRSENGGGDFKLVTSVQDTRYVDTNVEIGKPYFYKLKAKDVSGKESDFSETIKVSIKEKREVAAEKKAELVVNRTKITMIQPNPPFVWNDSLLVGGEIYVLDRDKEGIRVYNLSGKQVRTIGSRGYLPGQFVYPAGMGFLSNGRIVVSDYARKVVMVLTPEGELVKEWLFPTPKGLKEGQPLKLAVNGKDEIFVADGINLVIRVFSPDGTLLKTFGGARTKTNKGPEFFTGISGMVFAKDGTLFVSDWRSGDIHVIDKDQNHHSIIGYTSGVGTIIQPGKVLIDEEKKQVLVPDEMLATVQAYDMMTGEYKYTLTNEQGEIHESKTRGTWEIGNPVALHWGPGGSIIVVSSLTKLFYQVEVLK